MNKSTFVASVLVVCGAQAALADVVFDSASGQYRYQATLGAEADVLNVNVLTPISATGPAFPGTLGGGFTGVFENTGTTLANGDFGVAILEDVRMEAITSNASSSGFQLDVSGRARVEEIYRFGPAGGGGSVTATLTYLFSVDVATPFTLTYAGDFAGISNAIRFDRSNGASIFLWTFFSPAGPQSGTVTGVMAPGQYRLFVNQAAQDSLPGAYATDLTLTVGVIPAPSALGVLSLAGLCALRRKR
ncbi:MAG: hypothetical protein ACT4PL_00740 [Phycisphaerales bacterium]